MMSPHVVPRLLNVFRAGQISTSLNDASTVAQNELPRDAYARLTAGRYDQAPVSHLGHTVGWVKAEHLRTAPNVKSAMKPLARSAMVSTESPLADVLELLGQQDLVFTVHDRGLSGFIVLSDLDRHAARSHFYLLISGIEILLAELVRRTVPEATVVTHIRPDVRERYEAARALHEEADAVEYLYLEDLANLFIEEYSGRREWTNELTNRLTEICQFRSTVMHPARSLVGGRNAAQIAALAQGAESVTAALTQVLTDAEDTAD